MVFSPYSEEEMKRFQQELREDGAYNSVAFNYQYSAPEHHVHYPQTYSIYNSTRTEGMWICVSGEGGRGGVEVPYKNNRGSYWKFLKRTPKEYKIFFSFIILTAVKTITVVNETKS